MENFALVLEAVQDLSEIFVEALETTGFNVEAIRDGSNVRAELYRDKATSVLVKPISFSQLRDLSARLKL